MHGEVLEATRQGLGINISFQNHKESLSKLLKSIKSSETTGNNHMVEGDKVNSNNTQNNTNPLANTKNPTGFPDDTEFEHEFCNDLEKTLNERDLTRQ